MHDVSKVDRLHEIKKVEWYLSKQLGRRLRHHFFQASPNGKSGKTLLSIF